MHRFDRRSFITTAAVTGISVPAIIRASLAAPPSSLPGGVPRGAPLTLAVPPGGYAAEAARITQATLDTFWDPKVGMFKAPVMSAEAVPSDPAHNFGYVFWPSQIALHSLVEGAKRDPKKYRIPIWEVYCGIEKYFNARMHAYTAWLYFENNNDAYYDDNAWAVITLAEAYLATKRSDPAHATIYLNRAIDIMSNFVYAGWDATGKPGGEKWGTDPTKAGTDDKTVSATAGAALAALILARAGWNAAVNIDWAHSALSWIWDRMRDQDNLVRDGLQGKTWEMMPTKWTYNTGVPMRAYVEHYRLTRSQDSLDKATLLAKAAIDHESALFDKQITDPAKRFYNDGTYFVHYLLDGLLQVRQATPDAKLAAAITAECRRQANYGYQYLRDPKDKLYWRNWRLWRIGPEQLALWERFTGQTVALQTDSSEKSTDGKQWVKTLLANASAARLFWIASRF